MAWPPASGVAWTERDDLSPGTNNIDNFLYISDTVIYIRGVEIDEYDAIAGTRFQIGNLNTDFGQPSGQVSHKMFNMGTTLYAAIVKIAGPAYTPSAYRYNGTPNSWTKVWDAGGATGIAKAIANPSWAIIHTHSPDQFQKSSAPALAAWSDAALSPVVIPSVYETLNISTDNDNNEIYVPFVATDTNVYVYQLVGSTLTRVGNALNSGSYIRTPGLHWNQQAGSPFHWQWSTDCVTWSSPATTPTIEPIPCQNYTKTFGRSGGTLYFWDDSTNDWSTITDTLMLTPDSWEIVVLSDGTPIMGAEGAYDFTMERGTPLDTAFIPGPPVAVTGNLWVYKTIDGALSWSSKGVYT